MLGHSPPTPPKKKEDSLTRRSVAIEATATGNGKMEEGKLEAQMATPQQQQTTCKLDRLFAIR